MRVHIPLQATSLYRLTQLRFYVLPDTKRHFRYVLRFFPANLLGHYWTSIQTPDLIYPWNNFFCSFFNQSRLCKHKTTLNRTKLVALLTNIQPGNGLGLYQFTKQRLESKWGIHYRCYVTACKISIHILWLFLPLNIQTTTAILHIHAVNLTYT